MRARAFVHPQVACQMEDPFMVLPLADRTEGVVDLIRR